MFFVVFFGLDDSVRVYRVSKSHGRAVFNNKINAVDEVIRFYKQV